MQSATCQPRLLVTNLLSEWRFLVSACPIPQLHFPKSWGHVLLTELLHQLGEVQDKDPTGTLETQTGCQGPGGLPGCICLQSVCLQDAAAEVEAISLRGLTD